MTLEALQVMLQRYAALEASHGVRMFMGRPDRWFEEPRWRCVNDHVSTMYLKSEETGALCLECYEPLVLTFPEDQDGPLKEP